MPAMAGLIEFVQRLWTEWMQPAALVELGVLALCLGLAWLVVQRAHANDRLRSSAQASVWLGQRGVDGVLFPLLALGLALLARWLLAPLWPLAVLKLAVPILASLAIIRTTARVLSVAFPGSVLVRATERSVSWLVWGGLVLWLTGLLPTLLTELEAIHWRVGHVDVSVRGVIEGAVSAAVVLVLVLWLSHTIEARLLAASGVSVSVRRITANTTRAVMLLVGVLLALSAAGIPLAALSVLGGAIGVGIGLGLQKLAANYVSGFVILAERSLRIGDMVKVDNFEGRITDITMRYTVIRAINGREAIVPNEMLITQRVENSSFADPKVAMSSQVQVAYGTDLAALMPALCAVTASTPRVLADPAPAVQLSEFAADGLALTVVYWIGDLHNGQSNVRSDVNLALLAAINQAGVEIPYPQRVLRQVVA